MSTARTLRPRVDFGDDHDAGALSCLPCCRPDEILHSLVGAPVPPPEAPPETVELEGPSSSTACC